MAGRNEGCASIGCLGFCIVFVVAMCTGGGSDESASRRYDPPAYPAPAPPAVVTEPREWLYIHGDLNVRAEPDRDAPIVRTLHRGDMVQLGPGDARGWARLYTGAAGDEYVYRASDNVRSTAPAAASRQLHVGPRGGCYYLDDDGDKTYVDRSECRGVAQPLMSPRSSSSGSSGSSRRSSGGRQLHVGPRGGCYYINSNGNKTYVDRSECH